MWIMMTDGFVSIVEDDDDKSHVWVRARNRTHLENLFPYDAKIMETPDADYRYRVHTSKREIARIAALRVLGSIDYPNFKESVKEKPLKALYSQIWLAGLHYGDSINAA